jgi:hypothetical protein
MNDVKIPVPLSLYKQLMMDKDRLDWLQKIVTNSGTVIADTEKGYRVYTEQSSTRICDNVREAIDSARTDPQFF